DRARLERLQLSRSQYGNLARQAQIVDGAVTAQELARLGGQLAVHVLLVAIAVADQGVKFGQGEGVLDVGAQEGIWREHVIQILQLTYKRQEGVAPLLV